MPRKLRAPKARIGLSLSPAWRFALLSGELSGQTGDSGRLPGWVAQAGDDVVLVGDELWNAHRDALTAEGTEYGFAPYWKTNRTPSGAGFTRWRDDFLSAHRRIPTPNNQNALTDQDITK